MGNISDMTVGSPTRKILSFALPLILGYILQQLYLVIDAAIVGRFIGVKALAAVGASSSIMFLIMGFCNGACAGFAIPVAQSFGAKDYRLMRSYVGNALRLSLVIAVVVTVVTCIFCAPILHLVSTPREIFHPAWIFLLLNFIAIPFTMGYNILAGFIRALGNSKQPFFFLIISSVVNVAFDFLLIIVLGGMGSVTGSMLGAVIVTAGLEYLRIFDEPLEIMGVAIPLFRPGLRMVVFSVLLMVCVLFWRHGIMGTKEFTWDKLINFLKHPNFGRKKEVQRK